MNRPMAFGISTGAKGLRAPKGQESLAQALPWGLGVTPRCPEGAGISCSIAEEDHHEG
jgi:hypothetical protein